jgi:hypothetical protein
VNLSTVSARSTATIMQNEVGRSIAKDQTWHRFLAWHISDIFTLYHKSPHLSPPPGNVLRFLGFVPGIGLGNQLLSRASTSGIGIGSW